MWLCLAPRGDGIRNALRHRDGAGPAWLPTIYGLFIFLRPRSLNCSLKKNCLPACSIKLLLLHGRAAHSRPACPSSMSLAEIVWLELIINGMFYYILINGLRHDNSNSEKNHQSSAFWHFLDFFSAKKSGIHGESLKSVVESEGSKF